MTDNREPAYIYEGVDTVPSEDVHSIPLSEGVLNAINATKRAVNASREPGMPLSVLTNVTREAPLASLLVAFMLGVWVARR